MVQIPKPRAPSTGSDFERAIQLTPQKRAAILATLSASPDDMSRAAALVLTVTGRGDAHHAER
jgi:hypothetical protein